MSLDRKRFGEENDFVAKASYRCHELKMKKLSDNF